VVGPPPPTWEVEPSGARASEVAQGLWRLRLPLSWPGIPAVNAYALARRDGGITLVDCGGGGHPSYHAALEAALAASGHAVADVRSVVLTHYHSDHAGTLQWLVQRTGCEVLGHPAYAHFTDPAERPAEIAAARRRRARAEGVPDAALDRYADTAEETEGIDAPVHPDQPLREGAVIESTLGAWRVLETPGHCPSHVCLHEPASHTLIVGDLLSHEFHPWFDYGYSPDPVVETLSSLDRVLALGELSLVLPGHGRALDDVAELVEMHRVGLAERLEAVRCAVAAGAQTGHEVNYAVFGPDITDVDAVWRLTEILCYLRHDRLSGRMLRQTDEDGRFSYELAARPEAARPADTSGSWSPTSAIR
jgi:glyoxylase-like metal-dependent hydrolase (beta-lactamase superfamily II)